MINTRIIMIVRIYEMLLRLHLHTDFISESVYQIDKKSNKCGILNIMNAPFV